VTIANQDYETLLTEVINEVNAMRNKYDAFSQFTESKIAQYVLERKPMANQIEQLTRDLAVTNAQRAQIQAELVALTARVDKILMQRDKARSRVKFLEATRTYRLEQKLRSLVPQFLRTK
jgi:chromosome segregation ATPase